MERTRRKNRSIWRKGCGETSLHRSREQNDSKIQVRYLVRNAQQQCEILHWYCRCRIQSSRSQKAGTSEQMGQRSQAVNNVIGIPWRMTDGRWTVDGPKIREDQVPILPPPFEGATDAEGKNHQARHWEIRSHYRMPRLQYDQRQQEGTRTLRPLQGTDRRMPQKQSDQRGAGWRSAESRTDEKENRWRSSNSARIRVSNTCKTRAKRKSSWTWSRSQEKTAHEVSAVSSQSQRTAEGDGVSLEHGSRNASTVAVTTQEAIDGGCEKAMRIASVEQVELGTSWGCQSWVRYLSGRGKWTFLEDSRWAEQWDGTWRTTAIWWLRDVCVWRLIPACWL